MQRILSSQLGAYAGGPVTLAGWVHRRRLLKSVGFLILRDRAGLAQVVAAPELIAGFPEETVVRVTGAATANPAAPGGVEVTGPAIEALTDPAEAPPFDLYRPELAAALPTVLDHAAVGLRHPRRRAVFQLAAAAVAGYRRALDGLGFTEVYTPKIVGTATESGANVFAMDYFDRPAYLAQSPQFYKQTLVGVFERVYEVGPVFRAEPHDTVRHLAQFTSLDAELGFIEDHRDVMAVLRAAVAGMVAEIGTRAGTGIALPVVPEEIPEVHFADATRMLGTEGEPDLSPADERRLSDWAVREYGSEWLFVTGYPMRKRPFYTHPEPGRPAFSNSFDLLFRGQELVSGGQRLHRYGDYVAALAGQDLTPYATYLDAFRCGMPPHGGFALGLERFVSRLVGAANVREATLFPRDLHRLAP